MSEAPVRIRVAQDAEGFWTCREAVSGSQEYLRADIVEELRRLLQQSFAWTTAARAGIKNDRDPEYSKRNLLQFEEDVRAALSRLAEVSNG